MNIEHAVALITGTNRGLGQELVKALQAKGAKKIYAASRSGKSGLSGVIDIQLDVTKPDEIAHAAGIAKDVNLLINNAGVNFNSPLLNPADETYARAEMEVNYFGTLSICRAFAPILANNDGGTIVNIASIAGRVNIPVIGSLAASKAALISLTQGIRGQLAQQRTTVIAVMPGAIDTDMARFVPPPKAAPADVAQAIIEAIESGTEDVYPDDMAKYISHGLSANPKDVEKSMAAMVP